MSDLAASLVLRLESLQTRSAAVVRKAVYDWMATDWGVNVGKLVLDARAEISEGLRLKALRSQRRNEKLKQWVDRIPELQAATAGGPVTKVRLLLADDKSIAEVVKEVDRDRSFVIAVRDLDYAYGCKKDWTEARKAMPRRHRNRYEQFIKKGAQTTAPTKERVKQEGGEKPTEAHVAAGLKSHQFNWPIDQIRNMLSSDEYMAAQRFRDAYDGMQPPSATGGYDGAGGRADPAGKLGVTPAQQHSGREYNWFIKRLAPGLRGIVTTFVLNRAWGGAERAMTRVEFGRRYSIKPDLNEDQARGVSDGAAKAACGVLAKLSKDLDGELNRERAEIVQFISYDLDVLKQVRLAAEGPEAGRAGAQQKAVELVCSRTSHSRWLIRSSVKRTIEALERGRPFASAARSRHASTEPRVAA